MGKYGNEEDLWWQFLSPARCWEELLDPPNLGSTMAADHDVSGKLIRCLGFSRRGIFIGKGAASEVGQGALTIGRRSQGLGCATWW
jgi:hypothetical protein